MKKIKNRFSQGPSSRHNNLNRHYEGAHGYKSETRHPSQKTGKNDLKIRQPKLEKAKHPKEIHPGTTQRMGLSEKKPITKKSILKNNKAPDPNFGCWNIRRGLVKRELEIRELLNKQDLPVLFLVETDTMQILEQKDYSVEGFKTIFHKKEKSSNKTRIICLVKIEVQDSKIHIREDLMSSEFPSIWIEIIKTHNPNKQICGFYREWSSEGLLTWLY